MKKRDYDHRTSQLIPSLTVHLRAGSVNYGALQPCCVGFAFLSSSCFAVLWPPYKGGVDRRRTTNGLGSSTGPDAPWQDKMGKHKNKMVVMYVGMIHGWSKRIAVIIAGFPSPGRQIYGLSQPRRAACRYIYPRTWHRIPTFLPSSES